MQWLLRTIKNWLQRLSSYNQIAIAVFQRLRLFRDQVLILVFRKATRFKSVIIQILHHTYLFLLNDLQETLRDKDKLSNFFVSDWRRTCRDISTTKRKFLHISGIASLRQAIRAHASHKLFQRKLAKEFKNLTIALVTLIQGLAFNDLATKLVSIIEKFNILEFSGFILCFAILIRVTETYVLAGIQYDEDWDSQTIDLLLIFIIGFVEYALFSCITPGNSNFVKFNYILATFSAIGSLTYYRVLIKIRNGDLHKNIADPIKRANLNEIEKFTQYLNVILTGSVTFPCIAVIFVSLAISHTSFLIYSLSLDEAAILAANCINTILIATNTFTSFWLSLKV